MTAGRYKKLNMSALESLVTNYFLGLETNKTEFSGYIDGTDEFDRFNEDLRVIGFMFVIRTTSFGKAFLFNHTRKGGKSNVPFFGPLFQITKNQSYECRFGKHRSHGGNFSPENTKRIDQLSRKIGCKAKMHVTQLTIYPDFTIPEYHPKGSEKQMELRKKLKAAMAARPTPATVSRHIVSISRAAVHSHSMAASHASQTLHPRIVAEIRRLVAADDAMTVVRVRLRLETFVGRMTEESNGPAPSRQNRRYFPTNKVIYQHMRGSTAGRGARQTGAIALDRYIQTCTLGEEAATKVSREAEGGEIELVASVTSDKPEGDEIEMDREEVSDVIRDESKGDEVLFEQEVVSYVAKDQSEDHDIVVDSCVQLGHKTERISLPNAKEVALEDIQIKLSDDKIGKGMDISGEGWQDMGKVNNKADSKVTGAKSLDDQELAFDVMRCESHRDGLEESREVVSNASHEGCRRAEIVDGGTPLTVPSVGVKTVIPDQRSARDWPDAMAEVTRRQADVWTLLLSSRERVFATRDPSRLELAEAHFLAGLRALAADDIEAPGSVAGDIRVAGAPSCG